MANLQVSKTAITDAPKVVSGNTSVISAKNPVIQPSIQAHPISKKQSVLDKINSVLGKPFINTDIKNIDGKNYLILTRPKTDKDRPGYKGVNDLSMDSFKRALGLRKDVIKNCKYNDSFSTTRRSKWSDSATLEKGSTLTIPLEELGQEWYLIGGGDNKILRQAVQEYQK